MKRKGDQEWLAIAMSLWLDQKLKNDDGGDRGDRALVSKIEAVAGRLSNTSDKAANDMMARLLVLVLVWLWLYAKSRAKTIEFSPFSREMRGLVFSEGIGLISALEAALLFFPLGSSLCQNNHLPT